MKKAQNILAKIADRILSPITHRVARRVFAELASSEDFSRGVAAALWKTHPGEVIDYLSDVINPAEIAAKIDVTVEEVAEQFFASEIAEHISTWDIVEEIDLADLGRSIDPASIAREIEINSSEIASDIDLADLARDIVEEIDSQDIADRIDPQDIAGEFSISDVARAIDHEAIAEYVGAGAPSVADVLRSLASVIETSADRIDENGEPVAVEVVSDSDSLESTRTREEIASEFGEIGPQI